MTYYVLRRTRPCIPYLRISIIAAEHGLSSRLTLKDVQLRTVHVLYTPCNLSAPNKHPGFDSPAFQSGTLGHFEDPHSRY